MTYRPRLFAGIDLDERTRAACAAVTARLQAHGLNARFEPPGKLHVTLAFLGSVNPEQVEAIRTALRDAASAHFAFALTLDKIGAFPSERDPRIVWIGARDQGTAFRNLANSVRSVYADLGFTFDKHAVAHVTLARVKGVREHLPLLDVAPISLPVTALTLFESLPGESTTHYEVRDSAPLKQRA